MKYGPRNAPLPERFWSKVDKSGGSDACWKWAAHLNKGGYGYFMVGSRADGTMRMVKASRVAWELANGPIPDALCVCHRCDNPACVNPAHLWLGTHAENMADKARKGRARGGGTGSGEANHNARLNADIVAQIRIATGLPREIAARFGVSRPHVVNIRRGVSWSHIKTHGDDAA